MPLRLLTIRDAVFTKDCKSGQDVFHVYDPHALVQAAGHLKHKYGTENGEGVFFRGETRLHGSLSPSLFRGVSQAGQCRRIHMLNLAIAALRANNRIFSSFSEASHEGLLQHYGLRTSWIDLVDNVWVALWFACHGARCSGRFGEYLHFEKRTHHKEPDNHAYILLVAADQGKDTYQEPGIFIGKRTELIDLRASSPSIFLRPHAQHGLVFRMRGDTVMRPIDYSPQIRGILRISLADALTWLGDGRMLGIHALFPPPYYDHGYSILLNSGYAGNRALGAISHIGA